VGRYIAGGGGAIRPLPKNRCMEKLHEDPTVGYISRSGPEVKNGGSTVVLKMAHRRGSDAGQSRRS